MSCQVYQKIEISEKKLKIIFEKKAFVIIQPNRRIQANFILEIPEVYLNPSQKMEELLVQFCLFCYIF